MPMAYHQHTLATRAPGWAAAQGVPDLLPLDERVVLAPEEDLAEVAEVPAVADDAVLGDVAAR